MTTKNLSQHAIEHWGGYKTSVTDASKNNKGESLVESKLEVYNFDEICKSLFTGGNVPASADGIQFSKNIIQLIEFKSGFKQKVTKEKFDIEKGKCKETNMVCEYYWSLFWENQDRKISELIESVRLKAIESYMLLEKHLFPICRDNDSGKESRLIFTVVVDEDGIDGIEDALAELSKTEPETNNTLISIKQALKRLSNQKDCQGVDYLYDEIEVLTAKDFENQLKARMCC